MGKKNRNRKKRNRGGGSQNPGNKFERIMKQALLGVVHGNLPEVVGVLGVYMTFKDKPYVLELCMDQITGSALANSAVGAITNVGMSLLSKGGAPF